MEAARRWEYKVILNLPVIPASKINDLGSEGWELVTVTPYGKEATDKRPDLVYFFRRESL